MNRNRVFEKHYKNLFYIVKQQVCFFKYFNNKNKKSNFWKLDCDYRKDFRITIYLYFTKNYYPCQFYSVAAFG